MLAAKGIINGTSETTYSPGSQITRADFLTLLVRTLGLAAKPGDEQCFDDVTAYYARAVGIAKRLGIASGVGNNRFDPTALIARQDMMVLTDRALRVAGRLSGEGSASELEGFVDARAIAPYAAGSIASLIKDGLVKGSGNRIDPSGKTTRAEAAVLLYRIYNR